MDTETIYLQMEQDLDNLAKKHAGIADNEYIWGLVSKDQETCEMHFNNMRLHQQLARMYLKMKEDVLAFIETYDDEE